MNTVCFNKSALVLVTALLLGAGMSAQAVETPIPPNVDARRRPGGPTRVRMKQLGPQLTGRIKEINGGVLTLEFGTASTITTPHVSNGITKPTVPGRGRGGRQGGRRVTKNAMQTPTSAPNSTRTIKVHMDTTTNFAQHTKGSRADLVPGARIMAVGSRQGGVFQVRGLMIHPPSAGLSESDLQARLQIARTLLPNFANASETSGTANVSKEPVQAPGRAGRRRGRRANAGGITDTGANARGRGMMIRGVVTSAAQNAVKVRTENNQEVTLELPSTVQPTILGSMRREEFRVGQNVSFSWDENVSRTARTRRAGGTNQAAEVNATMFMRTDTSVSMLPGAINSAPTESDSKKDKTGKKAGKELDKDIKKKIDELENNKKDTTIKGSGGGTAMSEDEWEELSDSIKGKPSKEDGDSIIKIKKPGSR